jgi:hypothetical protein
MRLLLDECVPRPLRRELPGHEIKTVQELGWSGTRNGPLLKLIKGMSFDAFVTTDQRLEYQQNLEAAGVAVVVRSWRKATSCARSCPWYPSYAKLLRGYVRARSSV